MSSRSARGALVSAATLFVALTLASTAFASSTTVYVAAGGSDQAGSNTCSSGALPCASVTHALAEVSPGGTVYVSGTLDIFDASADAGDQNGITVAQNVTIAQDPGATAAILVGTGSGTPANASLVSVSGAHSVFLDGLTFENGNSTGFRGGAIANNSGGTLTVSGCTFTDNGSNARFESVSGGAISNGAGGGATGTLTVVDSTFTDNQTGAFGGAIDNADQGGSGTATIENSTFTGNSDMHNNGGAIDNGDNFGVGTLTVADSTFTDNVDPVGDGGAVDNGNDGGTGTLFVEGSTFSANSAAQGGAVDSGNDGALPPNTPSTGMGTVTVRDSSFNENVASMHNGGAIDNAANGSSGTVTVTGSTFTGNRAADGNGGAIDNGDSHGNGTLHVADSTFSGNGAANGDGGAIDNGDLSGTGAATVLDSTFNGNHAGAGGAIDTGDASSGHGTLTALADSFAADTAGTGAEISSGSQGGHGLVYAAADLFDGGCSGNGAGWTDAGYNASTSAGCLGASPAATDATVSPTIGSDLAPLAANGHATPTMLMLATDPAVGLLPADAPPVTLAGTRYTLCPTTDQRGYANLAGAACNPGSTQLAVPVITASVGSAAPKSAADWWAAPVTVSFTCTTVVALTAPCPAPVTLGANQPGQSVTETITGTDDVGSNSVTVGGINVDQTSPVLTITGPSNGTVYRTSPPAPACTATGGVSGVTPCSLSTSVAKNRMGYDETVAADATSNAGVQASVKISFSVIQRPSVRIAGPIAGATYLGSPPRAVCEAKATASPIKSCSLHIRRRRLGDGFRETLTAEAASTTGQTARARASFVVQTSTLPTFAGRRPLRGESYVLPLGRTYEIVVASEQRPRYVFAAQAPGRPAGGNVPFRLDGRIGRLRRWDFIVRLPRELADYPAWDLGVRIGGQLDVITVWT